MNRICPSEEILSEYLSGLLSQEDSMDLEKHLVLCNECRSLIAEAYKIVKKPGLGSIFVNMLFWFKKNYIFTASLFSLILSFIFPKYFLQFLTASILLGAKWIIDSKTTKTLITIHEAWKHDRSHKK